MAFGSDDVTTGASNDLQQVRSIARRMVAQWGFSATDERPSGGTLRAPVAWELPEKNMGSPTTASKATERAIDREERKLVNKAYATCKETLDSLPRYYQKAGEYVYGLPECVPSRDSDFCASAGPAAESAYKLMLRELKSRAARQYETPYGPVAF